MLSAADVTVGNLESSLGTGGTPENKQFTFQAPPSAIDALRAGGFDVVTMANNHGRDFGADGLAESLAIKDAQPDHFLIGIGHNDAEAYAPFIATIRGQRLAVIGATQVIDEELVAAWSAGPHYPGLASAKRVDALVAAVQGHGRRPTSSLCTCIGASRRAPARVATNKRSPSNSSTRGPTSSLVPTRTVWRAPVSSATPSSATASATSTSRRVVQTR